MHAQWDDPQELLDRRGEFVRAVVREWVKGVAKTGLSEHFQRCAPHPAEHVDLDAILASLSASLDALYNCIARLSISER